MSEFEDITIGELNKNLTFKPDPAMQMYDIYLNLSAHVPEVWSQIYQEELWTEWSPSSRRSWVERKYLIIQCPMDELEQHLVSLQKQVERTNARYRKFLAGERN